jgi:hypothetical protein
MSLFYEVLSSINNPNQAGSVDNLGLLLNTVQQATAGRGLDPTATQTVMSALSGPLQSALKQQSGVAGFGDLLSQLGGTNPSASALQSLFPSAVQQQMVSAVAQKTGIPAGTILAVLPVLIPAVAQMLNMGGHTTSRSASNNILNAFLDGDRDGDTDLGDVMKLAGRFMNPALYPAS